MVSLKDKLNNYFFGTNAKLEYNLLRDLVDEFYEGIPECRGKLSRDISALEAGERVTSRFFPNILTGASLIYFAFTQDFILSTLGVGISEGLRNGLGVYFKKTRHDLIKETSDAVQQKKHLEDEIGKYEKEIDEISKEIKKLNDEIKKFEKRKKDERKFDEDTDFGFDSSGYDGWLNPDDT